MTVRACALCSLFVPVDGISRGECHKFPRVEMKEPKDWCGEFEARVVVEPAKPNRTQRLRERDSVPVTQTAVGFDANGSPVDD